MLAIHTKNLTKIYKDTVAVDALNLDIQEGELVALLGVNGAGKTTTIKMLSCLTQPTSGDAILMGHSVRTDASAVKSLIAVSPQETAVAPLLSVQENLQLLCGIHRLSKKESAHRIRHLTDLLGLTAVSDKKAAKLSGGYQRRLSIALALVSQPAILFLDEPTLGLDVLARQELWDIIRALKGQVTVVLTTHYMEEAEALADRIAIMKEGRLLACDTAANLKAQTGEERFEQSFIRIVKGVAQ